jgi:hypothetical protein
MASLVNLTGRKFGKLTVASKTNRRSSNGGVVWLCKCDCGNIKEVIGHSLSTGNTSSCGCIPKNPNKFGNHQKHELTGTRIYMIWAGMKARCLKKQIKNYLRYGGRGIKVCDRWMKFENFYEDMRQGYSDNLTIERINNNGNYEPNNCRWATNKEQSNNRRNNHLITYKNKTQNVTQWANEYGINKYTLLTRLVRDQLSIERALNQI